FMRVFLFSSRRRHTRSTRDWSSDVCSSDLGAPITLLGLATGLQNRSPATGSCEHVPAMARARSATRSRLAMNTSWGGSGYLYTEIGRASCRERAENSGVAGPRQRAVKMIQR